MFGHEIVLGLIARPVVMADCMVGLITSMRCKRCRLQDGGPPCNFRLHQVSETRRRSLVLAGDRSTQAGEAVLTEGSSSALSNAFASFATISFGVPFGAKIPAQMLI